MDQKTIRDLLYRVATESAYRERLIADPVGVLGAAGIIIDPSDIPSTGITLPPNEEILQNLDAWSADIWSWGGNSMHLPRIPRIWLGLP